jgi:hypothetical protein
MATPLAEIQKGEIFRLTLAVPAHPDVRAYRLGDRSVGCKDLLPPAPDRHIRHHILEFAPMLANHGREVFPVHELEFFA